MRTKPQTSGAKTQGRFTKPNFRYVADEDVYICPAGERLTYRYTREEAGLATRRYWTSVCPACPMKELCTTDKERRVSRWEHEEVLEAVQRRLDENPEAMRQRRETAEHPFGTLKARMGATHFLMRRLTKPDHVPGRDSRPQNRKMSDSSTDGTITQHRALPLRVFAQPRPIAVVQHEAQFSIFR